MYTLLIFLVTIFLITAVAIRYKTPPFLTLIGGALFFGILSGMSLEAVIHESILGMGRIFAILGVVILSGAVMAKVMQEQHHVEQIVSDLRFVAHRPFSLSGIAGYLLAIPLMCCITAFVILTPVISCLAGEGNTAGRKGLLYTAALGSLISFALIYPSPVIIALFSALPDAALSPVLFDLIMIPVSLLILAAVIILMHNRFGSLGDSETSSGIPAITCAQEGSHARAWYPFLAMAIAMITGLTFFRLTPSSLIQLVMLAGMVTALVLAPSEIRNRAFGNGAKHAGVIIFDLCGAGALGAVLAAGALGTEAFSLLTVAVPALAVPFLLAALIQTAQGSRVVTAVVTGQIIAGTTLASSIEPIPLILLISGGACIISYVTDPYFWLVQRATGDEVVAVVKHYTIPLAAIGCLMFGIAVMMQVWMG
jgi:gluconate:H+ symporter, GntP family